MAIVLLVLPLLVGILMRLVAAVLVVAGYTLTILLVRHPVLVLRHVGGPLVLVLVRVLLLLRSLLSIPVALSVTILPALLVLGILLRILILVAALPTVLSTVSATTLTLSGSRVLLLTSRKRTLIILVSLIPTALVTAATAITIGIVTLGL